MSHYNCFGILSTKTFQQRISKYVKVLNICNKNHFKQKHYVV